MQTVTTCEGGGNVGVVTFKDQDKRGETEYLREHSGRCPKS